MDEGTTGLTDESVFGVESPAYVAIRWLQYGALLVTIGAIVFGLVVLPFSDPAAWPVTVPVMRGRVARVGLYAALLLGVSAMMRLLAQGYAMNGEPRMPDLALFGTLLRVTQWGHAWLLEAGAILAAGAAFVATRRGSRSAWPVLAVAGCAMAFAMALSGHAAAAPTLRTPALLADALHIIGASGWMGSLLVLVMVGIPAVLGTESPERLRCVSELVNLFSPTALAFAALTAVTGVFAAWLQVGAVSALWETRYGQLLLIKLSVLAVTAGLGAYNWRRVRPILSTSAGTDRLRRSAAVELGTGLLVLLVTAILVATPNGMDV